jgi:uncharacterized protein (DUF433 family)
MTEPPLPRVLVPHPHVRCDTHVLAGSPHVVGSRVPVRRLWVWFCGGASVTTLFRRYPSLGPARVLDALSFAYDNLDLIEADIAREQRMFVAKGGPTVGARPLAQLTLPFDDSLTIEGPPGRDWTGAHYPSASVQPPTRAAAGDGRAAKR